VFQAHSIEFKSVSAQIEPDSHEAEYEMKVQVIRSQGRAARLFVNIPMPLAAALDLQAGERVRWQVLGRSDLRLVRLEAPSPARGLKK